MKTEKLLIADSSEVFLLAMAETFQQNHQVLLCQTGKRALELLRQESFALLILDLSLPELDGITLLECAQKEQICPPVLALTTLLNEYVAEAVQRLGVRYLIRKPCDVQAVAARAMELLQLPEEARKQNARMFLTDLFLKLGLNPSHDGYPYLLECILRYSEIPGQAFTKELYPYVGKLFQRNGSLVERSMRAALDAAWERRDAALWQQYFPAAKKRPSCSLFISRLSRELEHFRNDFSRSRIS